MSWDQLHTFDNSAQQGRYTASVERLALLLSIKPHTKKFSYCWVVQFIFCLSHFQINSQLENENEVNLSHLIKSSICAIKQNKNQQNETRVRENVLLCLLFFEKSSSPKSSKNWWLRQEKIVGAQVGLRAISEALPQWPILSCGSFSANGFWNRMFLL